MTKSAEYRDALGKLYSWDEFLLQNSGLPGPRGNLELAQVVADLGDAKLFRRYLTNDPSRAPTNSPYEFLAFCGVVGLGRLLAEGDIAQFKALRGYACDPRWRIREGVAMALQRLGDVNMDLLLREMKVWSKGSPLEQRAAAAALCEPRLLINPGQARQVIRILDTITASIEKSKDRRSEEFQALRKGMGYCWSVAVAASPESGKRAMEKWYQSGDKDIRWIMRENLGKDRLARMDSQWVAKSKAVLGTS